MRISVLAAAGLMAGAIAVAALAQTRQYEVTIKPANDVAKGYIKTKVDKATVGTAPIVLWMNTAIDPDCSAHTPGPTLTIVEPPEHGTATINDEPFYISYPANDPRAACNRQKVPGHRAFYTAAAGFKGRDHLVLQGFQPGVGRVRRIDVNIDVR